MNRVANKADDGVFSGCATQEAPMPRAPLDPSRSLRTTLLVLGLAMTALPAFAAGGGGGSGSSGSGGSGSSGGSASSGGSMGGSGGGAMQSPTMLNGRSDLTTCPKGQVWSV